MTHGCRSPSTARVVLVVLGFILWSLTTVAHLDAAEEVAASPLFDEWIQGKNLEMGYNPKAHVFVARGAGRNRLECLMSAIGHFSDELGAKVETSAVIEGDKPAATVVSIMSENVIHGYDIQHAVILNNETEQLESLTSLKTRDGIPCALYTHSVDSAKVIAFFPSLDELRHEAIEKELSAAFVVDCVAHRRADSETIACVFVFKCGQRE